MADLGTLAGVATKSKVKTLHVDGPLAWDATLNPPIVCAVGSYPLTPPTDRATWKTISGTVRDSTGTPVARALRAVRRSTGEVLAETTSDASTGAYSMLVPDSAEAQVILLDNDAGVLENDLILRTFPV